MIVSAVQMVSSENAEENLEQAATLLAEAAGNDSEMVVLPENFAQMGMHETDKLAIAETVGQGPIQDFLSLKAKQHGFYLFAGTIPIKTDMEDKVTASQLVYDPNGELIAFYNKIHLFDVLVEGDQAYQESSVIEAGDQLSLVELPECNVGLSVCYDLRFPELYRELSGESANVFVVPSAFTFNTGKVHWEVLLRARAIENLSYVIAPNQGGKHSNGRQTYGHTMIIDYWGNVLEMIEQGPGVITADLDFSLQADQRENFPSLRHRRLY